MLGFVEPVHVLTIDRTLTEGVQRAVQDTAAFTAVGSGIITFSVRKSCITFFFLFSPFAIVSRVRVINCVVSVGCVTKVELKLMGLRRWFAKAM